MISLQQIQLPITHSDEELQNKIAELLGLDFEEVKNFTITKRAIDSRKKRQMIYFVYSVTIELDDPSSAKATAGKEKKIMKSSAAKKNIKHHRIEIKEPYVYEVPKAGAKKYKTRPIIIGTGPAGMFSALLLAKSGLRPLVIERGGDVDSRIRDVETFMNTGKLNTQSNIQFGEGGAGTFSDGKLNTLITNPRIK